MCGAYAWQLQYQLLGSFCVGHKLALVRSDSSEGAHPNAAWFLSGYISLSADPFWFSRSRAHELFADDCFREQGKKIEINEPEAFPERWELSLQIGVDPLSPITLYSYFCLFVCPRKRLSLRAAHHSPHGLQPFPCHCQETSLSWSTSPSWRSFSGWFCWDYLWNWNLAWLILSCRCSTGCMLGHEALGRRRRARRAPTLCSTRAAKPSRAPWLQSSLSVNYNLDPWRGDRTELCCHAARLPHYTVLWVLGSGLLGLFQVPQTCGLVETMQFFLLSWSAAILSLNFSLVLVKLPEKHCGSDAIYKSYVRKRDLFVSLFEGDDFRALERHWEITF